MNFTFNNINITLDEEIDNIKENKSNFIKISDTTPEILLKVGLPDRGIYLPREKILTGLLSSDNRNHGHKNEIGKKTLKKALPHLGDPLAISYTEPMEFGVYLEDKASTGKPLYVYIRYDNQRDINVILSVYGRIATDAEKFAYVDDTKVNKKWNTTDNLVKRFKMRLEKEIFTRDCFTKSNIKLII